MFRLEKRVIGLDLGTAMVKLAQIQSGRKGLEVLAASMVPVPEGAIDETGIADPELVGGVIREALSEAGLGRRTGRSAVCGIPGKHLTVRTLTVPTMDHSELREAVKWETAQYLPYPADEAAFDYVELGPGTTSGTLDVLSIAARQSVVDGVIRAVERAGLELIGLDAVPLALGRVFLAGGGVAPSLAAPQAAATRETAAGEAVAIADIGAATTDVSIFHQGQLRVSRSIGIAGRRFTAALGETLGLEPGEAEQVKAGRGTSLAADAPGAGSRAATIAQALRSVAEELGDEIQRSLDYFRAQNRWLPVGQLLITGGGGRLAGLERVLEEQLGLKVARGDSLLGSSPAPIWNVPADRVAPVSLGLALWEVNQA